MLKRFAIMLTVALMGCSSADNTTPPAEPCLTCDGAITEGWVGEPLPFCSDLDSKAYGDLEDCASVSKACQGDCYIDPRTGHVPGSIFTLQCIQCLSANGCGAQMSACLSRE